jgi:hypothetical protein
MKEVEKSTSFLLRPAVRMNEGLAEMQWTPRCHENASVIARLHGNFAELPFRPGKICRSAEVLFSFTHGRLNQQQRQHRGNAESVAEPGHGRSFSYVLW